MSSAIPAEGLQEKLDSAGSLAGQLNILLGHRLVPFTDILEQRGLISGDLARVASAHFRSLTPVDIVQVHEERRVLEGLVAEELDFLMIKGTALAATVYPDVQSRIRTDMDILVPPACLQNARRILSALGYRETWLEPSAVPLMQEQWSRRYKDRAFSVDVHWDLRNHPVFRDLMGFGELKAGSVELPKLGPGVRGLAHKHALLLSVMHWYANPPGDRSLIWLLDSELLWVGMDRGEQQSTIQLADERGLSGLLGHHLRLCRKWMAANVSMEDIEALERSGRGQLPTRLIWMSRSGLRRAWFEIRTEQGSKERFRRVGRLLFPSSQYMVQVYPDGSALGLTGLYLRRWFWLLIGHRMKGTR